MTPTTTCARTDSGATWTAGGRRGSRRPLLARGVTRRERRAVHLRVGQQRLRDRRRRRRTGSTSATRSPRAASRSWSPTSAPNGGPARTSSTSGPVTCSCSAPAARRRPTLTNTTTRRCPASPALDQPAERRPLRRRRPVVRHRGRRRHRRLPGPVLLRRRRPHATRSAPAPAVTRPTWTRVERRLPRPLAVDDGRRQPRRRRQRGQSCSARRTTGRSLRRTPAATSPTWTNPNCCDTFDVLATPTLYAGHRLLLRHGPLQPARAWPEPTTPATPRSRTIPTAAELRRFNWGHRLSELRDPGQQRRRCCSATASGPHRRHPGKSDRLDRSSPLLRSIGNALRPRRHRCDGRDAGVLRPGRPVHRPGPDDQAVSLRGHRRHEHLGPGRRQRHALRRHRHLRRRSQQRRPPATSRTLGGANIRDDAQRPTAAPPGHRTPSWTRS